VSSSIPRPSSAGCFALGVAADEERPEDRRSGRRTADHAAAIKQRPKLAVDARAEIRVGEPPLPAAAEEHAARGSERAREGFALGDAAVAGVQQGQAPCALIAKLLQP
jgi:hypothetical protein